MNFRLTLLATVLLCAMGATAQKILLTSTGKILKTSVSGMILNTGNSIVGTDAMGVITGTTAVANGHIVGTPGVTARGFVWGTTAYFPTLAAGQNLGSQAVSGTTGNYTCTIASGISSNNDYYACAYATAGGTTYYGNPVLFHTTALPLATSVTTGTLISATSNSASFNTHTYTGGTVSERGLVYSTTDNPLPTLDSHVEGGVAAATGTGSPFTSNLTDLAASTTYYVRAYAKNSDGGVAYDATPETVITQAASVIPVTVTDVDNNVYPAVTIGSQIWMGKNLKVTKYNDGTGIPNITVNSTWASTSNPAYCWYSNNEGTYKDPYGALYNWRAVGTGKLCPTGWHVPSETDYNYLVTYLGGASVAGGKAKEQGTSHWASPNTGATDESGFTAVGTGDRNYSTGSYENLRTDCYYWTSTVQTVNSTSKSFCFYTNNVTAPIGQASIKFGMSVRCLYDQNLPIVSIVSVSSITSISAVLKASLISQGTPVSTDYGFVVGYGSNTMPTYDAYDYKLAESSSNMSATLNNLTFGTTYSVRAYAKNSLGIVYSPSVISFTAEPSTVADRNGNVYGTVVIGSQVWTNRNSQATCPPGSPGEIIRIESASSWWGSDYAGFCWYNNNSANANPYGALYNYNAISGARICPVGWDIPSKTDWETLFNSLGGGAAAAQALKSGGSSGFNMIPSGGRYFVNGYIFNGMGEFGYYWTSTTKDANNAYQPYIGDNEVGMSYDSKGDGYSVRCIRDPLVLNTYYGGGYISYILQPGDPGYVAGQTHGIIAAPDDQSTSCIWGCSGTTVAGADGDNVGTGRQNTIDIVNACATASAARICDNLSLNGYDDWYLPSSEELRIVYSARGLWTIDDQYWSSTERSATSASASNHTNVITSTAKTTYCHVRCIRSF